jgi:hypothetical protein
MLVFMDESGDAGMKLGEGSSEFFVVTAVLFEDHDDADLCDERINLIRPELGLPEHFEFHFSKCSKAIRRNFLEKVAPFGFFYLSVVLDKLKLYSPEFRVKESLVKYASGLVFENAKPHLRDAIVVIDASGSKDFRNQLSTYLKKRIKGDGGCRLIKKVKTSRSDGNNLVQLADMVSGAVWRSFKHQDASLRGLISLRELRVQVWPP